MKWRTFKIKREPGFRINLIDIGFIVALSTLSAVCKWLLPDSTLFLLPIYLAVSFFLFCNVFRIGNRLEPLWYIPFTITAMVCLFYNNFYAFWIVVLVFLEPLKWGLILWRIKRGPYWGVGYKRWGQDRQRS